MRNPACPGTCRVRFWSAGCGGLAIWWCPVSNVLRSDWWFRVCGWAVLCPVSSVKCPKVPCSVVQRKLVAPCSCDLVVLPASLCSVVDFCCVPQGDVAVGAAQTLIVALTREECENRIHLEITDQFQCPNIMLDLCGDHVASKVRTQPTSCEIQHDRQRFLTDDDDGLGGNLLLSAAVHARLLWCTSIHRH